MGSFVRILVSLFVLICLGGAAVPLAQTPQPDIQPRTLPNFIDPGDSYEADTDVRRAYREALTQWRFTRQKAAVWDAGFCETGEGGEYDLYCGPEVGGGGLNATVVTRDVAPIMVQILFSEVAEREFNLAALAPDLQPWERRHVCGGSLVAQDWVLTAAHCFKSERADLYAVRLDVSDLSSETSRRIPVTQIVLHPDYDPGNNFNDIALLRIDRGDTPLVLRPQPLSLSDIRSDIEASKRLDEAILLDARTVFVRDGAARFLIDLDTGTRRVLPGVPPGRVIDAHRAGDGFLAVRSGRDIFLYDRDLSVPVQRRFAQDIQDFDVDPDRRQLAVLGRDGMLGLFDRTLTPVARSVGPTDAATLASLGEGRVRVGRNFPHGPQVWLIGAPSPDQDLGSFRPAPFFGAFHDFPGQPRVGYGVRENGAPFHRFLFEGDDHFLDYAEGTIRLLRNGETRTLRTSVFPPKLSLHPDGRYLIVLGEDPHNPNGPWGGDVHDLRTGGVEWSFRTDPHFMDSNVRFIDGGRRFVLWDSEGRTQIRDFRPEADPVMLPHSAALAEIRLIDETRSLLRTTVGTVEIADLAEPAIRTRIHHGPVIDGMDLIDDTLLSWSRDGRIRIWDAGDGTLVADYRLQDGGELIRGEGQTGQAIPQVSLVHLSGRRPQDEVDRPDSVQVFGWGKTTKSVHAPPSTALRMFAMSPIGWDRCIALQPATAQQARTADRTGSAPPPREELRDPNAFCARAPARKSCTGDSGGPVLDDGYQIGIVSRGSGVCKADQRTSTFTSVASFRDWIAATVCPTEEGEWSPTNYAFPSVCWGFGED